MVVLSLALKPHCLSIIETIEPKGQQPQYYIRDLKSFDAQTPYQAIIDTIKKLLTTSDGRGHRRFADAELIVDQSNVGRPSVRQFSACGLDPFIARRAEVSKQSVDEETGDYTVPVRNVPSGLQVLVQLGRLHIPADLAARVSLVGQIKVGEGPLVDSVGLGVWWSMLQCGDAFEPEDRKLNLFEQKAEKLKEDAAMFEEDYVPYRDPEEEW